MKPKPPIAAVILVAGTLTAAVVPPVPGSLLHAASPRASDEAESSQRRSAAEDRLDVEPEARVLEVLSGSW